MTKIMNKEEFYCMLVADGKNAVVRTKQIVAKPKLLSISETAVPINTSVYKQFLSTKSGEANKRNGDAFTGAYVSQVGQPAVFTWWVAYIESTYKILKNTMEIKDDK